MRVAAALKAPKRPKKAEIWEAHVWSHTWMISQYFSIGGILLWLASPALALIPCQPVMVRSIANRSGRGFSEKYIPMDLLI